MFAAVPAAGGWTVRRRRVGSPLAPRFAGFTYLALLWWVAISSVMLAALAQQWGIESRLQREIELVFRGEQIKAALVSYQRNTPMARSACRRVWTICWKTAGGR